MKKNKVILAFSILTLTILASCSTASSQSESAAVPAQVQNSIVPQTEDQVPRINVEDAKAALDSGKAVIVDVRSVESYTSGHAVGALSIPLSEFENNINTVPLEKDQWIITYCT